MMASSIPEATELKESSILQTTTSHEENREEVDPALERKLKWKLDLFILPLISSVYFFAAMVCSLLLVLFMLIQFP